LLLVLGIVVSVHLALALVFWIPALLVVATTPLTLGQAAVTYPTGFLATNVGLVTLMVLGGAWIKRDNLKQGGLHLARQLGAREVRPALSHAEQQYANIVQELCIASYRRPWCFRATCPSMPSLPAGKPGMRSLWCPWGHWSI